MLSFIFGEQVLVGGRKIHIIKMLATIITNGIHSELVTFKTTEMKYCLLILLFLCSIHGFTQTNVYHPYPQSWGATWQSEHGTSGLPGGPNYSYSATEWGGDTTINSVVYTKVYDGIGAGHQYAGGVRQNIALEEAYFIDDQNIEHDISFNQNALIGDTILTTMLTSYSPDTLFIVNSIDSISVDGAFRKSFSIAPLDVVSSSIVEATYLSGVGFIAYSGFEWWVSLQCHSVNHNWLFGGSPNPICVLSIDELPIEFILHLFPNPTTGLINISKTPILLRLYSSDGKEVCSDKFKLYDGVLDISQCEGGVYHAHFEFDSGVVIKKIIVQ